MQNYQKFIQLQNKKNRKMQQNIHYDYNNELANYINDNYKHMSDDEKKSMINKILLQDNTNKLLLTYAFYGLTIVPKENITLKEFIVTADSLLSLYHHKADGFYLDDPVWTKYLKGDMYDILENECIYENTLPIYLYNNGYVDTYLEKLLEHFNNISTNFTVAQKMIINEKERIAIVHFHVCNNSGDNSMHSKKIVKKFI